MNLKFKAGNNICVRFAFNKYIFAAFFLLGTLSANTSYQGYVTSSHPAAYHELQNVTLPGGIVTIEDSSHWVVAPYYWDQIAEWKVGDTLLLVPYRPWFNHYYEFKLVNERTQEEVLTNWCKPPSRENPKTFYIQRLHTYEIVMSDGTRWRIKNDDRPLTKTWKTNDIVIIGTNNGWFTWSNPNIIINMRNSSIIRGACME